MKFLLCIFLFVATAQGADVTNLFSGQSIATADRIGNFASGAAIPSQWHTNITFWSLNTGSTHWIFDPTKPFTAAELPNKFRVHIEGGTGWTNGIYNSTNYAVNYATGSDGTQNLLLLTTRPAPVGQTGGVGWYGHSWGTNKVVFWGNSLTHGTGASFPAHTTIQTAQLG